MAEVELEITEGVGVITLNAPQRRNALTPQMARELEAACEEIDADPAVGAAVVQGAGGHFCAGAHRDTLAAAGEDPARPSAYADLGSVYQAFARFGQLQVPSIAAARGSSVGAGVNLLLAADLRIVAADARVLSGFLRIGIHPGGGHFVLLERTAGREATVAMALFSEELDGRRAQELGLAWEALPDGEVEGRALELAVRTAKDPELARAALQSFRNELGPPVVPWPVALDAERAAQMWSLRRRELDDRGGAA